MLMHHFVPPERRRVRGDQSDCSIAIAPTVQRGYASETIKNELWRSRERRENRCPLAITTCNKTVKIRFISSARTHLGSFIKALNALSRAGDDLLLASLRPACSSIARLDLFPNELQIPSLICFGKISRANHDWKSVTLDQIHPFIFRIDATFARAPTTRGACPVFHSEPVVGNQFRVSLIKVYIRAVF